MKKSFARFSQALLVFGLLLSMVAGYAMDRLWHDRQSVAFQESAVEKLNLTEQWLTQFETKLNIAYSQYEAMRQPDINNYLKALKGKLKKITDIEQIELVTNDPSNRKSPPFAPDWSQLILSVQAKDTYMAILNWHKVLYPAKSLNVDHPSEAVEAQFNLSKLFEQNFAEIDLREFEVRVYIEGPYISEKFSSTVPIYAKAYIRHGNLAEFSFQWTFPFAATELRVVLFSTPSFWALHWPGFAVAGFFGFATIISFRMYQRFHARLLHAHERTVTLYERGEAVAFIAHELPQPLTGIIGCLESSLARLRDGKAIPEILLRDLEQALASAKRATTFLADIKTYILQGQPSDSMEPVDIAKLIQNVAALAELDARLQGIMLHVSAEGTGLHVMASPIALEMVLLNLLRNSAEAIRNGGQGSSITLEATAEGDNVMLCVSDDGPGVSHPEELFQPFKSTKPNGSGLGLVYCERQVVKRFGGKIHDRNRPPPEHGACFTITLPRCRA